MKLLKQYAKQCGHCNRITLLPQENNWTCVSCGYSVIKRKHELSKIQLKKINIINLLKFSEHNIFCFV